MGDKPKNLDDIDRFWDLNSLLPKKRPVAPTHRAPNTDTVEISLDSKSEREQGTPIPPREQASLQTQLQTNLQTPLQSRYQTQTPRARAEEYRSRPLDPYLVYTPKSRLIKRVEVSRWDSRFNFYENFRADAHRLWARTASECEHVPFFSYVPQYAQLKYAQLKWYLWWRENVRHGVYLRCDFCYILLYIYEIINCPELVPPTKGLGLLCDIWLAYRSEHRRIDSYMCEWLCDYCLINELSCPSERLEAILGEITASASFKEFYMDFGEASAAVGVLMNMTTYDWRSSRYVTSDNIAVFRTNISGAFDKVWREILSPAEHGDARAHGTVKELRIERTAYEGALCVYDMKRTLKIEYISYTRSPKFRFVITDIIKYSENRVRMALGIKSRLKVQELTDAMRACIDEYFEENLPAKKKEHTAKKSESTAEKSEYDILYEPIRSEFSLENAIKIERDSWQTTKILTEAFDEKEPEQYREAPTPAPAPVPPLIHALGNTQADDDFETLIRTLDEHSREALILLANGDTNGIAVSAAKCGMLADALADSINENSFDIIGDSIIEPEGQGYRLIADYEGDIKKWLK